MTTVVWTDRSRTETYQRCPRLRWLEYHQSGRGIAPAKKSLALVVGGSVHVGLAALLEGRSEDDAVACALADFAPHRSALGLDLREELPAADPAAAPLDDLVAQMTATAAQLGVPLDDPTVQALYATQSSRRAEYDEWLGREQSALVEGLVRAYARRRLQPLLAEFEVLEVEREGQWLLHHRDDDPEADCYEGYDLYFMSRPDALLRSRTDNSLYLLSYKTAASWDIRKARDAEHDMQGLSEGVEVERRLGEWWANLHGDGPIDPVEGRTQAMVDYLAALSAPPRILGIRYEYMLKGSRYEDRNLSARFSVPVWAQRSHLIRAWQGLDETQWCWSYEFHKDDGAASKLYYKSWTPRAVWESMPVRDWIDLLDTATETMSAYDSTTGMEPRALGWHSEAQAQGYTSEHPLDAIFPAPMTIYRQDDQLRDWIEQVEAQEVRVAEAVAAVAAASDEGDERHLLNVHFGQSRRSCSYPTECAMVRVCFGGEDIRRDPLASGLYKIRVVNHPQEANS